MRKEDYIYVRNVAFDHLIRTGEKLGTSGQKTRIVKSIRRELLSASIVDINSYPKYLETKPAKEFALYRIFTGKSVDNILEPINENRNTQNKITQEIILKNLENRIKQGLNDKKYYPVITGDIAAYRILTAKEIKIIPSKGIFSPEATVKAKSPRGII